MSQKGRRNNLTYRDVLCRVANAERTIKGAATDLFVLARAAASQDEWEAKCQIEEDWLLSDDAGEMKHIELPEHWGQIKSDIRGGWKAGLDFTTIPSYHKMKLAKAKANKDKREARAEAKAEPLPSEGHDGVIILEVDNKGEAKAQGHKPRRGTTRDDPEPRHERSVEDALAAGEVLDAKSNVICPPELMEMLKYLTRLSPLGQARLIKRFTKEARDAYGLQQQGLKHSAEIRDAG